VQIPPRGQSRAMWFSMPSCAGPVYAFPADDPARRLDIDESPFVSRTRRDSLRPAGVHWGSWLARPRCEEYSPADLLVVRGQGCSTPDCSALASGSDRGPSRPGSDRLRAHIAVGARQPGVSRPGQRHNPSEVRRPKCGNQRRPQSTRPCQYADGLGSSERKRPSS
jgi:hypothetical protein